MKNLYLALVLVCSSIYYSNAQIGYAGIIESGVFNVFNDTINVPITRMHFSTSFSNGITLGKNGYVGIGVAYNRYEKIALIPVTLDFKYCLFGDGFSNDPEPFSLYFGVSGGYSFELRNTNLPQTSYDRGLYLKTNVGGMIHVNSDARLIINLGHKIQEPEVRLINVKQYQSIYATVGLIIRPTKADKKTKTTKKKESKKSPLDMLNQ